MNNEAIQAFIMSFYFKWLQPKPSFYIYNTYKCSWISIVKHDMYTVKTKESVSIKYAVPMCRKEALHYLKQLKDCVLVQIKKAT